MNNTATATGAAKHNATQTLRPTNSGETHDTTACVGADSADMVVCCTLYRAHGCSTAHTTSSGERQSRRTGGVHKERVLSYRTNTAKARMLVKRLDQVLLVDRNLVGLVALRLRRTTAYASDR